MKQKTFRYPAVILLKWPTTVLILFLSALIGAFRRRWSVPSDWWVLGAFPAIYFLFAIFSRIDIGDRHVLPIYPFVLLFTSGIYEWTRNRPWGTVLLLTAVLVNAADALRYAPDYLSYFMPFVRPAQSYKLLTASSLDWGQGLLAMRQYEKANPDEAISLAYFGSVEPQVYGIHARRLGENERAVGTVIVSATSLSGQYLNNPESYRWVLEYPRVGILNHSLYVFRVGQQGSAREELFRHLEAGNEVNSEVNVNKEGLACPPIWLGMGLTTGRHEAVRSKGEAWLSSRIRPHPEPASRLLGPIVLERGQLPGRATSDLPHRPET